MATISPHLQSTPTVDWYDARGNRIVTDDGIRLGLLVESGDGTVMRSLMFSSVDTSHSMEFRCNATIQLLPPPYVISKQAIWDLTVQCESQPIYTKLLMLIFLATQSMIQHQVTDQTHHLVGIKTSLMSMLHVCYIYTADSSDTTRSGQSGLIYIGAGVGGGVGIVVIFIVVLVIFVCCKRSENRKQR